MSLRYAVIGSSGQVGQEFAKCLPADNLILLAHDRVDVADPASVHDCVGGLKCDVVVNLAAFHDVNGCEGDPARAFRVNAEGAGNVAQAAGRKGCKVIYFSSDYVFGLNGQRRTPYRESDSVGPLNIYGASKVAGEHLVRAATEDHLIVRTSSLFGVVTSKKGWTFPEMIIRRARGGEALRVVNDQEMSPTYTLDLVRAVIRLIETGATGTIHVTNAGGCSWFEFATTTLALIGLPFAVAPVNSDAFPAKARRPAYSRMQSERLESVRVPALRDWRDGLRAYLVEKGELKENT